MADNTPPVPSRPAPLPTVEASSNKGLLPPLPDSAYPPGATPLPSVADPSKKRARLKAIGGAVLGAAITIAAAYGIDLCKTAAAVGWTPAACAASK